MFKQRTGKLKLSKLSPEIVLLIVIGVIFIYASWPTIVRKIEDATDKEISQDKVGIITNISVVPTTWNESIKTRIETDQGIFHIYGTISVMKSVDVKIVNYSSGRQYACLSDRENCLEVVNTK